MRPLTYDRVLAFGQRALLSVRSLLGIRTSFIPARKKLGRDSHRGLYIFKLIHTFFAYLLKTFRPLPIRFRIYHLKLHS